MKYRKISSIVLMALLGSSYAVQVKQEITTADGPQEPIVAPTPIKIEEDEVEGSTGKKKSKSSSKKKGGSSDKDGVHSTNKFHEIVGADGDFGRMNMNDVTKGLPDRFAMNGANRRVRDIHEINSTTDTNSRYIPDEYEASLGVQNRWSHDRNTSKEESKTKKKKTFKIEGEIVIKEEE